MASTQTTLEDSNSSQPTTNPNTNTVTPDLQLSYENESGNTIVIRSYTHHDEFVREVDQEYMFNYVTGEWECSCRFVHDYDLTDDSERLAGDGSNWRGTGREWTSWFTHRHYERLALRFNYDTIPDADTVNEHNPIDRPT